MFLEIILLDRNYIRHIQDFLSNLFLGVRSIQDHVELAKFIQTKHGNILLYSAGYVYGRNASNGTKTYWQCRNKDKEERCLARAITDGNYVTDLKGVHIHATNILQSDVILENQY